MAEIPMQGTGSSLGAAFSSLLGKVSTGAPRMSYDRVTTVSRFHQLFGTDRGYKAMEQAGLDVKQSRTMQNWLDGTSQPSKANADAINRAYESMRQGGVPSWFKKKRLSIFGRVANGNDVRDRGSGNNAPLRVEMSSATPAGWSRIEDAHADGADDDDMSDLIAEEIVDEDLPSSGGWGFPGGSYTVSA